MLFLVLGLSFVLLLALNAFFVLAEFAIVKVRASRVAELVAAGDTRANTLTTIQEHLDEYLSVCQVGITLASIALGMVGKKATDALVGSGDHDFLRYAIAIGLSYIIVSGSHIVLGEQVPKYVAIRIADRAALLCSTPLRVTRLIFYPWLWVLTALANGVLRLMGMGRPTGEEHHSEEELRIILDESQERGIMSFRRLIFMENVFDFGELRVRDAMRPRFQVRCLNARASWEENLAVIKASRFSRYPLITGGPDRPVGFVHMKDLVIRAAEGAPDLRSVVRPILTTTENTPLEGLLATMQRRRIHAALVTGAGGRWTGFLTLEDVIEELVGTIRDEFEDEEPVRLADALSLDGIQLDIDADSPMGAVRQALLRMPPDAVPLPVGQLLRLLEVKGHLVGTYLGQGIGLPHARVTGLPRPFLMILRSEQGVSCDATTEKAHLLFVLLTPAGQPRVHQRLLSIIATLLHESEYVKDRLLTATSADDVLEVIRTGEQAVLD